MVINYFLFADLYDEALQYNDCELYIAERGWQEWMDKFQSNEIILILESIFELSKKNITDIREMMDVSRAEFSRMLKIPLRSVENWELGQTKPSDYLISLIAYSAYIKGELDNDDK